jgi:hypothetical protein
MQNHYPMAGAYHDPWQVTAGDAKTKESLAGFARGLNHTDRAIERFLTQLSESDEKSAVVLYGDHQPGFWPEDAYELNGERAMKSTPYFIWTNFDTPDLETAPMTSPIFFMPMLFRQIGADLPPYYALLSELQEQIAAMEQGVRYDATGRDITDAPLSARAEKLLRDYRLVQYDLSVGERYSQDALFYPQD